MSKGSEECAICDGLTCRGGQHKRCIRRNRRKSVVSAILDRYGGVRVVVTHKHLLQEHTRCDEICVVVPNLTVNEPIGWNDIPSVIALAHLTLDRWINNNTPNQRWAAEACKMRQLRKLENPQRALNLEHIAET